MPSNYAHYRFGQELYPWLPEGARRDIAAFPELFKIGLHGPDIFFYYQPLHSNTVTRKGAAMHARLGSDFLDPAVRVVRECELDRGERAYLYGFVCHFMLDSCSHWYVEKAIGETGVSHVGIEGEFDRMLMKLDGLDPVRTMTAPHIVPSEENGEVIARFFPDLTGKQVQTALRGMVRYSNLFCCPDGAKRKVVTGGIHLLGLDESVGGMVINLEPDPRCERSNQVLLDLFDTALEETEDLMPLVEESLRTGCPLPERFHRTFGPDEISEKDYETYETGEIMDTV